MIYTLIAFFSSFIATLLIIRFQHLHNHLSADSDLTGPQKFHTVSVPRIGGIGIAVGIFTATLFRLQPNLYVDLSITLLVCTVPVFAIGLAEDITKKIGVKTRLTFTAIAAAMTAIFLDAQINRLDITGIDHLLSLPGVAIIFTAFAISGLANAYNIIDGFNGLSSMVGMITLSGLSYVSYIVGDPEMMYLSLVMTGSILGFFLWNYPRGRIFLGDGGAYLIGFWIATISILLTVRHENISPWFALLLNAYPILETLFTIYRRKIHQGKNPGQPDGIHFHTLIYKRVINPIRHEHKNSFFNVNARTSPYLWALTMMAIVPAILWRESTPVLISFTLLFIISYIWLYKRIVTFKTPNWM